MTWAGFRGSGFMIIKFIDIKQQKNIFKLFAAGEVAERLKAPLSKSGIL